jgi:hypothetical protein
MGCSVRTNRHGYLAFRLHFHGMESHEGTKFKDTPENRRKVEARVRVIDQEIRDGVFDYLRWFPTGNLAARFHRDAMPLAVRLVTARGFFREWAGASASGRMVTAKWRRNRESYIRVHVLPVLGTVRLDELTPRHIVDLQARLQGNGMAPSTVDRVVHSAFRGMLRDAELAGYRTCGLGQLFDRRFVTRISQGSDTAEIDPYSDEERVLEWFWNSRRPYHAFVYFDSGQGRDPPRQLVCAGPTST